MKKFLLLRAKRKLVLESRRAFTLIELLAVIVIMGIMLAIVAPAIVGTMNSSRLTQGGDELYSLISQAQQIASTRGRPIEVRFYKETTSDAGEVSGYRGIMIVSRYEQGESNPSDLTSPLVAPLSVVEFGGMTTLPRGVLITESGQTSTLITNAPLQPATEAAPLKILKAGKLETFSLSDWGAYRGFLCMPEGTNLSPAAGTKWFLTLVADQNLTSSPADLKNFVTIQIDAVTARLSLYRP